MASNLLISNLLITHITHPLLILTVQVIAVHGSAVIDVRREETPPLPKHDGGGHPPRGRPVPSCHCHPPCPSLPPAPGTPSGSRPRCCCPPPPPACVEPRPPCRVPPGLDLCPPHPRQEFSKPPCRPPPPSPPHGDNNADDQCSVEATREPSPEDDKPRDTQSVSSSSLPPRAGGGGRAQNIAPCCSRDRTADQSGPPHGRFLVVVVIVVGFSAGGERGGSSGSDNDMACGRMLCFWFGGDVNYLGVNDVVWVGPVGMEKMTVLHYQ